MVDEEELRPWSGGVRRRRRGRLRRRGHHDRFSPLADGGVRGVKPSHSAQLVRSFSVWNDRQHSETIENLMRIVGCGFERDSLTTRKVARKVKLFPERCVHE